MKTHFGRRTILVIALATCANAGIIHVPADQPSIQAGIDAATTGDTVLVAAGIYYENINFYGKTITVTSEQGLGLTIHRWSSA